MFEIAVYGLYASLALTVIALIGDIAVLATRRSAKSRAQTLVGAAVSSESPATSSPVSDGGSPDGAANLSTEPVRSRGVAWYSTAFVLISLVLLTFYLAVRTATTGHGPFTNQHEFAVTFAWGILGLYMIFEKLYNVRALSLIVLPVSAALLLYAIMLGTEIRTVMPALQNNLLLALHVGTAVLSYGAACVSFGAAVLYLVAPRIKWKSMPRQELLDEISYRAAVVTFPLLTLMIILGAIWADTAWNRYWGWDPKETAALVTWLIWGAYLHARVVRNWRGRKAAWLIIFGFAAVMFAFFGNHFFGGLHSYA